MLKAIGMKRVAIALLLVGVVAGAAGAQVFQRVQRARYIDTGLFTVGSREEVSLHVSLIGRGGPPSQLVLRLFDEDGAVVARDDVMLQPGESATLRHGGPGRFRAQAEVLDPLILVGQSRAVTATVEIIDGLSAEIRPVCGPGENLPAGRD